MFRLSKKKVIITLIIINIIILILYLISLKPKNVDITCDGIMYSINAYLEKDYDNLDIKSTKVHMKGKLYKAWFKEQYFVGYIDTDIVPVDDVVLKPAIVESINTLPTKIKYDYKDRTHNPKMEDYANTFICKDMRGIHLDFQKDSGYEGYAVVAPGKDLEDIKDIWNVIRDKIARALRSII